MEGFKVSHRLESSSTSKLGLSPGTLIYTGQMKDQETIINYHCLNGEFVESGTLLTEQFNLLPVGKTFSWYEIRGLNNISFIESIGGRFEINKMWLEDLLNVNQLASFDELDSNNFLSFPYLRFNTRTNKFNKEQISIFFNDKTIISFQESGEIIFESIVERLRTNPGKYAKRKPNYLAYAILDLCVDSYLDIIQDLETKIDTFEYQIEKNPNLILKKRIYHFRRDCLLFIRQVNPILDVVHKLKSSQSLIKQSEIKVNLTDLFNHANQVLHSADTLKDMLYNLTELFHEEINYRTNVIIKILTVITTIFNPLTFLVGVYGMNFENMPELKTQYGYYIIWFILVTLALGTFWAFKRKRWI